MRWNDWFLCVILGISCLCATAQQVTLKIATIVPEGSSWIKCIKDIDQECRKIGVKFIIYPGGVLGENQAMLAKIRAGQLDGAGLSAAAMSEFSSRLRIMEIPYMFRSLDEWKEVFKQIRAEIESDLEKSNFIVLGWAYAGFAYIYSKDPVRNVQDFRNTKPWIYPGDPLMEDCFRELQASGVPLGTSGVLPALQTGMVNCVYNSPYGLLAVQWHPGMKYWTDLPIENPIGAVIISKAAYEKIPPAYRGLFKDICRKHFRELGKKIDQDNETSQQELTDTYKMVKVPPDVEWVKETQAFSTRIADRQVGRLYSKEFLEKVRKLQENFRQK